MTLFVDLKVGQTLLLEVDPEDRRKDMSIALQEKRGRAARLAIDADPSIRIKHTRSKHAPN
jgi:hypothetical protein